MLYITIEIDKMLLAKYNILKVPLLNMIVFDKGNAYEECCSSQYNYYV
jgi:hypothetical protein